MTHGQSLDPPGSAPLTNEVNLVLGNNSITKLPVELFTLTNLTVLSMRESGHSQLIDRCLRFIPCPRK